MLVSSGRTYEHAPDFPLDHTPLEHLPLPFYMTLPLRRFFER